MAIENVKKIAVIGAGGMGSGIAEICSRLGGYDVMMCDTTQDQVQRGLDNQRNNLKRFFVDKGKITAANFNKARKYLAVCKEIGGSEVLWNNWCDLIAAKYPKHFEAGDDVSWLHSNAIMGIHQTIARA